MHSFDWIYFPQRVNDLLVNAKIKLERAQKHAEDKKNSSQKTIERLQQEYDQMVIERRENDKQIEEVRDEARQVESKVCMLCFSLSEMLTHC